MKDRPLCVHGDHKDGSKWCEEARESLYNRLQLLRIRFGTDFETHGGKKAMYVGSLTDLWPMLPYGEIGTVESTTESCVMVQWECTVDGHPRPFYMHSYKEVEFLKTDDDGVIPPEEIERAKLKIASRILTLALPCPVCGSRLLHFCEEYGYRHVFCTGDYGKTCDAPRPKHCGAGGPRISDQFPQLMALAVWNIRSVPSALTKEIRGFPKGDVEVCKVVGHADVPDSPCPWCLGTRIRIEHQADVDSWHGFCVGCGGFSPWWPADYENRAKSAADVVRNWKRRPTA